jgi:hypothetical protein
MSQNNPFLSKSELPQVYPSPEALALPGTTMNLCPSPFFSSTIITRLKSKQIPKGEIQSMSCMDEYTTKEPQTELWRLYGEMDIKNVRQWWKEQNTVSH